MGSRPGLLRLVRRAAQLRHRARLRPRRERPDRPLLAGHLPPRRQGHPQVPHDLLAGAAARRRAAGPRARVRPRLPADARRVRGRAQDVQVARQRARPVRGDGDLRHRRAALLPVPRGLVRAGRRRLHDHVRRALRERAGERARKPREPHAVHDRPLPRRRRARDRRRPGADPGLRRPRRRGQRPPRPRRDHAGARPHLATGPETQPLRGGARAVAARQGRGERRRARHDPALARRGPQGRDRAAGALHPRDRGQAARRARRGGRHARGRALRRPPRRRPRREAAASVPEAAQ